MSDWRRSNWTWQEKRSLFIFLLCNVILLLTYILLPKLPKETILELDSPKIQNLVLAIETEQKESSGQRQLIKFPFNPNYITDYQAYLFSIDLETLEAIRAYRSSGEWINSVADFQSVTKWDDSRVEEIAEYLKFPEWVSNNNQRKVNSPQRKVKKQITPRDLNAASKEELRAIPGIGEVLATRILEWRDRLGGFSHEQQVNHVFGLNDWAKSNLLEHFYITPMEVEPRLNINKATASDLATIPGVDFEMARKIWEYQHLREGINDLEELNKIEGMTQGKLKLIALYLYVN